MNQQFTTPMMKQYERIKKQYLDCLLFYRMGDFYELFLEDAHIGAKVLDITLTSRAKGKDGKIPMAGVPYHAVDSYLAKLVKGGYKVAICEQMTQPNNRGIIEREVVRVVTPGTILDEKALNKKENNFIISVEITENTVGIAVCDISTGYFQTNELVSSNVAQTVKDELARINPVECIISEDLYSTPEILKILHVDENVNITSFKNWNMYALQAKKTICQHFKVSTLEGFGLHDKPTAAVAVALLLGYLKETQKDKIEHIKTIKIIDDQEHLLMDRSTMINLELFSTIREMETRGSLLSVLDQTQTAMGGRLLRSWIRKPLLKREKILLRQDSVEELFTKKNFRKQLQNDLETIGDTERMLARLSVGIGNARDLIHLKTSIISVLKVKEQLRAGTSALLKTTHKNISKNLEVIVNEIESTLLEEPPVSIRDGGMIKSDVNEKLKTLRTLVGGGKEWIATLEIEERKRTGIGSLKVRFNKIFGFYIEISKSNVHLVPSDYMRKQTLVNGERFITPELKKQEEIILTAEEEMNILEYSLFQELLKKVLSQTESIQQASEAIAILDCIMSFSDVAEKNRYIRPKLLYSGEIRIKQGRHPVVEQLLTETQFVPNDVLLDTVRQQLLVITGPNMAGKSVFIRQVALIVLLTQMGSFVPANQAHISLVDRIFVRSGASDMITSGMSTFMVEMVETAYILNHATGHSLIIMDEIGRGTSTYDGISLAWAVAEYLVCHEKNPAKTLFATHYHELQELQTLYPKKIRNFHMAVIEEQDTPVFLHTILPGGASASYGIAVAKLAGVPNTVIEKAKTLLQEMEVKKHTVTPQKETNQTQNSESFTALLQEIKQLNLHQTTPLAALNKLAELQTKTKDLQ